MTLIVRPAGQQHQAACQAFLLHGFRSSSDPGDRCVVNSAPIISPSPRTSPMTGCWSCSLRRSSSSSLPWRAAFSTSALLSSPARWRRPRRRRWRCRHRSRRAMPGVQRAARSGRVTMPESGRPGGNAFGHDQHIRDHPSCSTAKNFPVRPKPVWISSATSKTPFSRQNSASSARKPGGGAT